MKSKFEKNAFRQQKVNTLFLLFAPLQVLH